MGEMFENMNNIRRLSGDIPPEFLLTHPLSSSRISDAFNAAENISEPGTKENSLEFSFIKSRLEVYYEKIPSNSVRIYESRVNESRSDSNVYGLALAYNKVNDFNNSLVLIDSLIRKYPKNLLLNTSKISNEDDSKSLSFSTRENKTTNVTEFYNLLYQYRNDCLIAGLEYNKEYYTDGALRPEESIFFKLTIVPFGQTSSPDIMK